MAQMRCRKCGYQISPAEGHPGEFVVESDDTAEGLSYCPPNPDARNVSKHVKAGSAAALPS